MIPELLRNAELRVFYCYITLNDKCGFDSQRQRLKDLGAHSTMILADWYVHTYGEDLESNKTFNTKIAGNCRNFSLLTVVIRS